MREIDGTIWYSASDLVNFRGCRHATFLDLRQLETPVTFDEDPAEHELLWLEPACFHRWGIESLEDILPPRIRRSSIDW